MRKGNIFSALRDFCFVGFLSYLWGMETFTVYTLSLVNTNQVLILPMRNGNWGKRGLFMKMLIVLILPMRNGNPQNFSNLLYNFIPFLSYLWGMETRDGLVCVEEQWRQVLILPMRNGNTCQLWKACHVCFRSYPTYEEWKLLSSLVICFNPLAFLSYLWGMETSITFCWIFYNLIVLILPMRNGNSDI